MKQQGRRCSRATRRNTGQECAQCRTQGLKHDSQRVVGTCTRTHTPAVTRHGMRLPPALGGCGTGGPGARDGLAALPAAPHRAAARAAPARHPSHPDCMLSVKRGSCCCKQQQPRPSRPPRQLASTVAIAPAWEASATPHPCSQPLAPHPSTPCRQPTALPLAHRRVLGRPGRATPRATANSCSFQPLLLRPLAHCHPQLALPGCRPG